MPDDARRLAETFDADNLARLPRDHNYLLTLELVLDVALAQGLTRLVEAVTPLLLPYAGRAVINAGAVMFHGVTDDPLSRACALLGDHDGRVWLRAPRWTTYRRLGATWWARAAGGGRTARPGGRSGGGSMTLRPGPAGVWFVGHDGTEAPRPGAPRAGAPAHPPGPRRARGARHPARRCAGRRVRSRPHRRPDRLVAYRRRLPRSTPSSTGRTSGPTRAWPTSSRPSGRRCWPRWPPRPAWEVAPAPRAAAPSAPGSPSARPSPRPCRPFRPRTRGRPAPRRPRAHRPQLHLPARPRPTSELAALTPCRDGGRREGENRGRTRIPPTPPPAPAPGTGYADLRALFINCTLKRSPEPSNTQGLVDISARIMETHGVHGRRRPGGRPRHRHRRLARHDRARLGRATPGQRSSRRSWPPTSSSWPDRSGSATTAR